MCIRDSFVGEELEAVIDAIASDSPYAGPVKMKMDLGVDVLPKMCIRDRCSMESTPFSSATFTPSGDSVWAATG